MKIGFIGFGSMAQAMAEGFVRTGALQPDQIGACARDEQKLHRNADSQGFRTFRSAAELVAFADVVIVAVKPHQVENVLTPLHGMFVGKVLLSVVAGYPFDRYEAILDAGTHHLSTIPNTPVSVGDGIVICECCHSLTDAEREAIEALLSHVGMVQWVETAQLNIAGTISGCGPAFVCMFMEALADAAVKHGIGRVDAYRLVSQMVAGTGRLQAATGVHPGMMKDAVCSPGGTTIVGVAELERKGLRGAVIDAIDAIQAKR